jgi:glucosamine kinase
VLKIVVPYYIGIDGGGTKTTCAVGEDTSVLALATTGPSNIVRVGEMQTRESLHACIRQACAAAGITLQEISRTCLGGSGAGHPELARVVREILAEILFTPIDVVGDMQIALEAAFGSGEGVIVIAGTGSIAYGRDRQGSTLRAGGWGFAIGDEGSAHWIGRSAIQALLRASDRRDDVANSPLAKALFKTWNVKSLADLARAANSVPPPDFAALFRALVSCHDDVATNVLTNAGRELAELARVVLRRLFADLATGPVPVAMTGGVFRHAEVVRQTFHNELRKLDPRAEIKSEVVDPVQGALRMARREAEKSFRSDVPNHE